MTALVEKLSSIAGGGKLSEREWRVRCRLKWHTKPKSSVRHLLYGERKPSIEEARQIEAAHFKLCAEKIQEHDEATKRLFENMRIALMAMEQSDPGFFGPHIQEARELLLRHRNPADQAGDKD